MKVLKPFISVVSSLSLALSLAACGASNTASNSANNGTASTGAKTEPAAKSGAKTIRFGHSSPVGNPLDQSANKFKELVDKYTNGSIKVEVFPASQLGGELTQVQQVQAGSLEMAVASTAPVGNIVPEITLFDLPFVFKDYQVIDKVTTAPFGQKILDKMSDKGMIGLSYWENGFRNLTNSKHPITKLEDIKDLKIRTMENPLHLDVWKAMGANPTPMSFDQLFNALQQKVIDAQENPVQLIYSSKFYEAQKYMTLTNHVYSPYVVVMNKAFFDGLSKDEQSAIKKAASEARDFDLKASRAELQQDIDQLKAKGMQVDSLSDADREKIKAAIKPVVDKYAAKYPDLSKELFDTIAKAEKEETK